MSSREEKRPEKRVTHLMTLWPDMDVQVDKVSKMGVNASISRSDFNRISEIKRVLEKVSFQEVRFIRKGMSPELGDAALQELLGRLSDDVLRERSVALLGRFDRYQLEKAYLVLLSYAGKEFFV